MARQILHKPSGVESNIGRTSGASNGYRWSNGRPSILKKSRSKIVKELDAAFSRFIRLKAVNLDGFVECYTCGRSYEVKKIQNGHFMSRARYATRWHEDNCRPQCYGCNVMQQGRQYDFGLNLDREREGLADEMHQLSLTTVKFATWELEEKLAYYREKVKELE